MRIQTRFSSRSSSPSLSDDEDLVITPIESSQSQQQPQQQQQNPVSADRKQARPSVSSSFDSSSQETAMMWRRMLALQRRYHCYNSARISAALESDGEVVPPRACLDLINDSIAEMPLPPEARREVAALLSNGTAAGNSRESDDYDLMDRDEDEDYLELPPAARTISLSSLGSTSRSKLLQRRRRRVMRRH